MGGGALFCLAEPSDGVDGSLLLEGGIGGDCTGVISCVLIWSGATTGVGGSGLFMSELSVRLMLGGGVDVVAAKLSNDTVWGCL
jgi:hypothetical protein